MCPWVGSHAPSFGRRFQGAAQLCRVSLTTGGIAPARLRYDRLIPVAGLAGPRCLAGDPLGNCVPARLSSVASMAPGEVCHGPRCSLARLRPVVLEYCSCDLPVGSAWSPQCVRPWGRRPLRPVPCCSRCMCVCGVLAHLAPVHRCAGPLCVVRGVRGRVALVHQCARFVRYACVFGGFAPPPPPPFFLLALYFFSLLCCCFLTEEKNQKGGASTLQAQALGAAVQ